MNLSRDEWSAMVNQPDCGCQEKTQLTQQQLGIAFSLWAPLMLSKKEWDVMSAGVPNAFIQTPMPDDNKEVIIKITGVLVHLMVEMSPAPHCPQERHESTACYSTQCLAWDTHCISALVHHFQEGFGRVWICIQSTWPMCCQQDGKGRAAHHQVPCWCLDV